MQPADTGGRGAGGDGGGCVGGGGGMYHTYSRNECLLEECEFAELR